MFLRNSRNSLDWNCSDTLGLYSEVIHTCVPYFACFLVPCQECFRCQICLLQTVAGVTHKKREMQKTVYSVLEHFQWQSVVLFCFVLATYLLMTFRTDVQMLKLFYCPNYEVYHN